MTRPGQAEAALTGGRDYDHHDDRRTETAGVAVAVTEPRSGAPPMVPPARSRPRAGYPAGPGPVTPELRLSPTRDSDGPVHRPGLSPPASHDSEAESDSESAAAADSLSQSRAAGATASAGQLSRAGPGPAAARRP